MLAAAASGSYWRLCSEEALAFKQKGLLQGNLLQTVKSAALREVTCKESSYPVNG